MTTSSEQPGRRSIYIPDDLWDRIRQAAADEGSRRGHPASISEWLRDAAEEKLERDRSAPTPEGKD